MFKSVFSTILCTALLSSISGCSSIGGLDEIAFGKDQLSHVHYITESEYETGHAFAKGVIIAVEATKLDDLDDGIVDSAVDTVGDHSASMAQDAIRSSTGYSGVGGLVGSVAGNAASTMISMFSRKAKEKSGVIVTVEYETGGQAPFRQLGEPSDYPLGAKVLLRQSTQGFQMYVVR